jgi:hypothetical protein
VEVVVTNLCADVVQGTCAGHARSQQVSTRNAVCRSAQGSACSRPQATHVSGNSLSTPKQARKPTAAHSPKINMPPAKHVRCSNRLLVSPMVPRSTSALASLTMLPSSLPSHTWRTRYFRTPAIDDLYSSRGTCTYISRHAGGTCCCFLDLQA